MTAIKNSNNLGRTMAQDGAITRVDGFTKSTSQIRDRPPAPGTTLDETCSRGGPCAYLEEVGF